MSGVYLYALLSAPPAGEPGVGVCAEPLRTVAAGGLVALVGDVAAAPAPSAGTLRAQDALLRRVAAGLDAVLPARFGTLVADDTALADALERRRSQLARALDRVAGCEQMTLRVWGETRAVLGPAQPRGDGPGTRYLAERRDAHERAASVVELAPLRPGLAGLVRAERVQRHEAPPLLATVQHLVPRGACARYTQAVDAARQALAPWRVSVTGSWLPYAFGEEAA
jgi:hypothetical protein